MRRMLQAIIPDERRHAALAWQAVHWALNKGGPEVASAVQAELRTCVTEELCSPPSHQLHQPWHDSAQIHAEMARHGVLSQEDDRHSACMALELLVLPLAEAVGLTSAELLPLTDTSHCGKQFKQMGCNAALQVQATLNDIILALGGDAAELHLGPHDH